MTNTFDPPPEEKPEKKYIATKNIAEQKPEQDTTIPGKATEATPKYRNINKVISNHVDGNGFLTNVNFISRWNILGPFPYEQDKSAPDKSKSVLHLSLVKDEKKLTGDEKTEAPLKWQLARFETLDKPGEINLRKFFKDEQDSLMAYAVTYLQCEKDLSNLTLYAGSSGYIKVWINYKLVHTYDQAARQGKWDQDVVKGIGLKKGYNQIVVKCVAVEKKWNFYLRLADANNQPLKFIPSKEVKKLKAGKAP